MYRDRKELEFICRLDKTYYQPSKRVKVSFKNKNKSPVYGLIVGNVKGRVHVSKEDSFCVPVQWCFVENIEKYYQSPLKDRENLIDKISCFEVVNIDFID